MKIKSYIHFIKESLKEKIEEKSLWKLDEDQIRDYFIEFEDAGYLLTVEFGFVEETTKHYYNRPSEQKEVYTEKVTSGDNVRPAYQIRIERGSSVNSEDITDSLKFVYSILKSEVDANITLHDADTDVDINTTIIKGGIFINTEPDDDKSGEEAESYLALFVKQKQSFKITQKDLEEYYGWNVEVEKNGQLWTEIDLEDLSYYLLKSKGRYNEILVKGQEFMWDYYDISQYSPDIISLFNYDLDKENQKLVVKAMIKELGGYRQVINHIVDECDNNIYEKIKEMSEEELIKYLLSERFYNTIKQLGEDSEVLDEVKETVANWEMSAHCDTNYRETVNEFDSIVKDELGQFEKIEKEVTKYYNSKDSEGNQVRKEYKTDVTYYQFPYNNDWLENLDSEDLFNKDLNEIFRNWLSEQCFSRELKPHFSDYGNYSKSEMNKSIESLLK